MSKENRGFASMSPEKQTVIASKGGHAAHQKGTAHEWSHEEAVIAGRKGAEARRLKREALAKVSTENALAGKPAATAGIQA